MVGEIVETPFYYSLIAKVSKQNRTGEIQWLEVLVWPSPCHCHTNTCQPSLQHPTVTLSRDWEKLSPLSPVFNHVVYSSLATSCKCCVAQAPLKG